MEEEHLEVGEVSYGDSYCVVCQNIYIDEDGYCFTCMEVARAYMASESW